MIENAGFPSSKGYLDVQVKENGDNPLGLPYLRHLFGSRKNGSTYQHSRARVCSATSLSISLHLHHHPLGPARLKVRIYHRATNAKNINLSISVSFLEITYSQTCHLQNAPTSGHLPRCHLSRLHCVVPSGHHLRGIDDE